MKKFLLLVVVLLVIVGILGYTRGWFTVNTDGKVEVKVDKEKFNADKDAFSKSVGDKTKAMKEQFTHLMKKTEGLTGDEKVQAQKELTDLQEKHDRLEKQLHELETASQDKFTSLKEDLSKSLKEVETKMDELSKKLDRTKDK